MQDRHRIIAILATTQIATWGSLYYAFSIVAPDIAREMGRSAQLVYGAFSWSLLVAGLVATPVGILLDRHGGRLMMGAGSLCCGVGFIVLATSHSPLAYVAAWTVLGLAMASTLYEAAFATINRKFREGARHTISTLTLFGGLASTIFWPLTQAINSALGWRDTFLCYAAIQLAICLPLHLLLGADAAPAAARPTHERRSHTLAEALRHHAFWKLALAFSANTFVFSAMSVHLIPILTQLGHPANLAVFMAMLIGPMQVAGRLGERTIARNLAPRTVGVYCFAALPAALFALASFGAHAWAVALFCVLYGLSNGIITIVRGTIPQTMFGPENYGAISGAMAGPALFSKAAGPLVAALFLSTLASPLLLVALFLLISLASVGCYLAAVKVEASGAAFSR